MKKQIKKAIKDYQCCGCITGPYPDCFKESDGGVGCGEHHAGTMIGGPMTKIFLGLPKGFCRLGQQKDMQIYIFENQEQQNKQWEYDMFNIPVWKHKTKNGHILVRGYMPRINLGFIHVILDGDISKISCLEITENDIMEMD